MNQNEPAISRIDDTSIHHLNTQRSQSMCLILIILLIVMLLDRRVVVDVAMI